MNKLLLGKILLTLIFVLPASASAMGGRVDVGVSIPLPPGIEFSAPPEMVVIPETYVYAVPDVDVDIFFYGGWWWRPWDGRWYRSQSYNSGWTHYQSVPSFYREVPSGWRDDYRQRRWGGREWNYQRIPEQQVQRNWNNWEKNRHWEKQNTWGVKGLKPHARSQQPSPALQPQHRKQQQVREPAQRQPERQQPRQVHEQRPQSHQREQQNVRESSQRQQPRPQPREVREQRSPRQQRNAQQQSRPQQGKPDKGRNDKQDRKQHDR